MKSSKINVLDLIMRIEPLSDEEKAFVRKKYPRKESRLRYGIWKAPQRNGKQLVIMNEFNIHHGRRPGVDNSIDFIIDVPLSEKEYEEGVANFGMNSRTYLMYRYENVEQVMREDNKCGYETPQIFINKCRDLGLTEAPNLFTEL